MIRQIRKRDGRVVDFNPLNIKKAINKASQATKTPIDIERVYEYTIKTLEEKFNGKIASVEDIQNEVEKALIHFDYPDTAKAYIIYRQVRNNEREGKYLVDIISLIDDYIEQKDWRVKENANASYSVSGLTFHIAGSVIANYSLYKYPKHISHAHRNGDIHIHDLSFGLVTAYCAGWDLEKLFLEGINNIPGKINSRPANHLTSATWQMINFIGTLQNEWAGAQAFNCYSDDTEVLTDKGWKLFKNLDRTEQIATLNKTTNRIEYQSPTKYFSKYYNGLMLHFRNKGLDMLVTPNHRLLLRQRTKTSKYTRPLILKEADSLGFDNTGRCRHGIPRYSEFFGEDKKFINIGNKKIKTEDFMPLLGIYLSEGSINRAGAKKGHYRIEITQIKEKTRIEIEELLKRLPFKYSKDKHCFYVYGKEIYKFFESQGYSHDRYIPREYLNLNKKYLKILLEWLIKGDGHNNSNGHRFYFTVSEKLRNDVIELVIKSGLYCSSYIFAKTGDEHTLSDGRTFKNKKDLWAVSIYDSDRDICIYEPEEILYNGTIHCVEVPNHIILTKRNGYVTWCGNSVDTLLAPFIRKDELTYKQVKQAMQGLIFNLNVPSRWAGQSPFSNFTFDWTIPEDRMDDIPMIGGKAMDFAYGDLQEESLMINKAFMEVLTEGDAKGSTFTFPIPTINITKEFDWNGPLTDELFALTAKYGPYYFANFVKSDLNPRDIRSMCPLSGNEKILTKSTRGRNVEYCTIRNIYKSPKEEYEIFSDGRFVKGRFNAYKNQRMIEISLENGHKIKMSENHLNFVMKDKESSEEVIKGKDIVVGMYLPYSLNVYEGFGGTHEMGYFVGAFAGDGSIGDKESSIIFSLSIGEKETVCKKLKDIAEKYFGANCIVIDYNDTKLLTLRVNSRAAVGLCNDFVEGMKTYKCYKARTFGMSAEFRKGIIEGHLDTDGGNRNRIYTSSLKMIETLNMLCATLGTSTSIFKDDRDGRYSKNPNYAVLIYKLNRNQYGDVWFKDNNRLWIKIKSIIKCKSETAYCFEVLNGAPVFTVGTTGILTHNCRLSLRLDELRNKMGGLFGAGSQTGSIAVTTINLPRIGYLSKDDNEFFSRLDNMLDIAKEAMEIKRAVIMKNLDRGLMPYTKRYLGHFNGHFSTIGIIGMNECLVNYMGKGISDKDSYNFGLGVMDHIRSKLIEIQKETGNLYNLEATPAEGTTRRLAAKDKKYYPDIIVANEQKWREQKVAPYYTNSIHLPVGFTNDIFESLDLEEEFLTKFTGGCVKHIYLGERLPSADSARNLVKKVCSNYKVPYISITPSFSVCPTHGYVNGAHDTCPKEI